MGFYFLHLGLTKRPERYAEIDDTEPYARPVNPGILEVEGGTAISSLRLLGSHPCQTHKETKCAVAHTLSQ